MAYTPGVEMPRYTGIRGSKRDTLEIVHDILSCVYELQLRNKLRAVPKTAVMQCSNLNTNSFKRHLNILLSNGLLVVEPLGEKLMITMQGLAFRHMTAKLLEKLYLGSVKPTLVSIGSQAYIAIAQIKPELISLPNNALIAPAILETCDYLIAAVNDRLSCLTERQKRVMLICCKGLTCNVMLEAPSPEQLDLDEVIRATLNCIEGG